jgi:1-acyl-sn-glycerol-3-phosphate acyltransferase
MSLHSLYTLFAYYLTLLFFAAFGLTLSVAGFLLGWLPATERVERFFQRMIHRNFALFHWWCAFARLVEVRYRGLERIPRGGLVLVANHPALIDITCLLARVPEAVCIFKPAIRRNPVLGAAARRAGYLAGDGGHDLVRAAAEKVGAGHTLVIFPEGTRTPPGTVVQPFRPGFALIARRGGVPIQLVHIRTDSNVLTKGRAWWRPPQLPAHIVVTVGPLVRPEPAEHAEEISARIEAWFRTFPADAALNQPKSPGTLDDFFWSAHP